MARKKPYEDGCATAHALDLIGERWALLIVRELIPGPQRFSDLRASLPGISSNILATRLAGLEEVFVIAKRVLPPPAAAQVYELTDWGAELEPIIKAIGKWAAKSPTMAEGMPMSAASVMLSFRTMFNSAKAEGARLEFDMTMNGRDHSVTVDNGHLRIVPGRLSGSQTKIVGSSDMIAGVVYGGVPLPEAERDGLRIEGDRSVFEKFATFFPLPEKAVNGCVSMGDK